MDCPTVYTIGHSSQPLEEFVETLRRHAIDVVADVRSVPRSQFAPRFDRESLAKALSEAGIEYRYLGAELGGRGAGDRAARLQCLRSIAAEAARARIALMCAEEDPLRCHRLGLANQLARMAVKVTHIRRGARTSEHSVQMTLELG